MKKREQGMLTVESSIVLTLLLLFMLFLFSFARLYRAQNLMGHATIQTADAVALESFLRETALSSDINDVVYLANTITDSTAISAEGLESLRSANLPKIARQKFVAAIAPTEQEADLKLRDMGVRDGLDGIDFSQSWVDLGRDDVIIVATYTLEMQFPLFGGDGMTVTKTAKSKTFGDILFEVSTEVNQPSWGSTKGDDKVVHGSTIEISATPNYGYRFVSWNDGVTDNPRIVTVTNAMHYVAIFEKMGNGINLSINNGAYGVYETERGKVSGAGQYLYLDTVTITAQPKEHYWFAGWDDNGDGIPDNTSATRSVTIEQVEDTYFFSAIFRPNVYTVTVQTNNSTYGSAWVMQGGHQGTVLQAEYGSMVTLEARPNTNYRFVRWSHGDSQLSPTVRVEGNVTYTANFEPNTCTVTFYSNGRVHATAQVIRGSSVFGSESFTSSRMPNNPTKSGGQFHEWRYNGMTFTGFTTVDRDITVDATWKYTVILNANGGTISGAGSQSYTVYENDYFNFGNHTPARNGYRFSGWGSGYSGNVRITADVTVWASWQCKHQYDDGRTMYYPVGGIKPEHTCKNSTVTYLCSGCSNQYKKTGTGQCDFSAWCGTVHKYNRPARYYCSRGTHTWYEYGCITCRYCGKLENRTQDAYGVFRSGNGCFWCVKHRGHLIEFETGLNVSRPIRLDDRHGKNGPWETR